MMLQVEYGLVVELELTAGNCTSQIILQLSLGPCLRFHMLLEKAEAIAAFGLGLIERQICVLDEFRSRCGILRSQSDADAGSKRQRPAVQVVRPPDFLENSFRQCDRSVFQIPFGIQNNGELVTAEPGDAINFACRSP